MLSLAFSANATEAVRASRRITNEEMRRVNKGTSEGFVFRPELLSGTLRTLSIHGGLQGFAVRQKQIRPPFGCWTGWKAGPQAGLPAPRALLGVFSEDPGGHGSLILHHRGLQRVGQFGS